MRDAVRSIDRVCRVEWVRGAAAVDGAVPDLLFEVPHGATRAHHFDELRDELRGDYGDGLRDFFFVNTDVGAPELAAAIARQVVAQQPERTALVVSCEMPRTFCDTNRVVRPDEVGRGSQKGELTPGLPPWVVDDRDRQLLLDRYFAYRAVADAAFEAVCTQDAGRALCVHTYAPRSLQVDVDEDIGRSLRAAYAPDRVATWPLRAEVDLITHDDHDDELACAALAQRAEQAFREDGFQVVRNGTYTLHASTVAHAFAQRYRDRTLCFELRRDLLLDEFVPFVELIPEPQRVARAAAPLVRSLTEGT